MLMGEAYTKLKLAGDGGCLGMSKGQLRHGPSSKYPGDTVCRKVDYDFNARESMTIKKDLQLQ